MHASTHACRWFTTDADGLPPNTAWLGVACCVVERVGRSPMMVMPSAVQVGMVDFDLTPLGERRRRLPLQRKVKQVGRMIA